MKAPISRWRTIGVNAYDGIRLHGVGCCSTLVDARSQRAVSLSRDIWVLTPSWSSEPP